MIRITYLSCILFVQHQDSVTVLPWTLHMSTVGKTFVGEIIKTGCAVGDTKGSAYTSRTLVWTLCYLLWTPYAVLYKCKSLDSWNPWPGNQNFCYFVILRLSCVLSWDITQTSSSQSYNQSKNPCCIRNHYKNTIYKPWYVSTT